MRHVGHAGHQNRLDREIEAAMLDGDLVVLSRGASHDNPGHHHRHNPGHHHGVDHGRHAGHHAARDHAGHRHLDHRAEQADGRMIHQGPTGRLVYAAHERDGHITTSGRRALPRELYALPPGPREKRRGIKGRVPFDTHARAISGLSRLSGMHRRNPKKLTAGQLHAARKKILDYWSQIEPTI